MRLKSFSFLSFLITCGLSLFAACSDNTIPSLAIEEKTVNFSAESASRDIPVKTNADSWTADVQGNAQSWLEARRMGTSLRIIVSANDNWDTREGAIRVVADNLAETVTVQQMGQAPTILSTSSSYAISADGGDLTLEITSNIEYEIIVPPHAEWITAQEDNAARATMITQSYVYTVAFNITSDERTADIIIKQIGGTVEKKVSITQRGQGEFSGVDGSEIKDDIKVPVARGAASSFQSGEGIERSFDGNLNTIYHSAWNNSAANYFPITLEYFFESQERIDYLVYHPRPTGSNGHFIETEIWVATQDNPDYVKAMDFNFIGSSTATRVIFDESVERPAAIKFVVKSGTGDGQGFAACAEMEFFRTNPDNFDPLTLFVDLTCTELKPCVILEAIAQVSNSLYRNIAFHIYNETYPREFRIAEFNAYPHPDDWARANKTSTLSLLDNSTGISVTEGEDLIVFVGNTLGRPIGLRVINFNVPGGDGWSQASSTYPLSPGVNKLRMRNSGLVYVMYHTPDWESAPPVKVHFAAGRVNGYFDSQKHSPSEWITRLAAAVDNNFDVVGKYAHLTFPTSAFRAHAATNGAELIDAYDNIVYLQKEFMGLMKFNRPPVNRVYFHVVHNNAFMFAGAYRTGYHANTASTILNLNSLKGRTGNTDAMWGPAHEVGHVFQTRPGFRWHGMTEVTVNVKSLLVQTEWGLPSRIEIENMGRWNNRYEKAFQSAFVRNEPFPELGAVREVDVFCQLVPLWQLQLYFANVLGQMDTYKYLYEEVRIRPDLSTAGTQQLAFVKMMSEITQTNLINFFQRWGFLTPFDSRIEDYGDAQMLITQSQIDETIAHIENLNFSPPAYIIEYISDSNWEIFKNRLPIQSGIAQRNGTTITMTNWRNVVAYEVYESDTLVFISNRNSFNLDSPVTANTKVYAVAFDGRKVEVAF
jgi:hypothetical protein